MLNKGNSLALFVGMQTSTVTWRTVWRFLKKTGNRTAIWPRNPTPVHTHMPSSGKPELRDTCTPMFIASPFIIARTWKQPRCPSADECIRNLWFIYTMEYYSVIKKNTFESVLMRLWNWSPLYRVK